MLRYITEKIPMQIGANACTRSLTGHVLSDIFKECSFGIKQNFLKNIKTHKSRKRSWNVRETLAIFFQYEIPFLGWGCEVFNVGRATHWAFADGLGVNPKADPETIGLAILILRQVERTSLWQGTPRDIIGRKLGGHCSHNRFYIHQAPLAYKVVYS